MDDMTRFEDRFEDRVRAFAITGVRQVDSAAVAHAIAIEHPGRRAGSGLRWPGLTLDRRAWAIVVAIGLLVTLLGGALRVGARLLLPPPVELRPAHLVYALDDGIYVAEPDGTNPVRIVASDPGAGCDRPRIGGGLLSPDGRHIAYRSAWSDQCPGMTTYIRDLAGNLVASFPGFGDSVAWSPDASRIATWLDEDMKTIGVYGLDGIRQAVLDGSRACCGDYDPRWSPDGASILIPAHDASGNPGPNWELPIDGGTPRPVPAHDPRANRSFAVSPDGAQVAFIAEERVLPVTYQAWLDDQLVKYSLVVADADGTDQRVLIEEEPGEHLGRGWARDPLWSPDGDRIAIVVDHDETLDREGYVSELTSDLRVVDPRTGIVTTLASVRGTQPIETIEFSPDGDQILVGQTDIDGTRSLRSVNTDGSGSQRLVVGYNVGAWLTLPAGATDPAAP